MNSEEGGGVRELKESVLSERSLEFAAKILSLARRLRKDGDFIVSHQVGRSGTSIGANIRESQFASSRADFVAKLHIALKETNETVYWLELLRRTKDISDMEFDYCIEGGNSMTMFEVMRNKFLKEGYKLPDVVFWNVCSHGNNIPVNFSETGAALVSGFSPIIFNMVMGEEISPEYIMNKIILSERYEKIK